jgi:hypothetical protein
MNRPERFELEPFMESAEITRSPTGGAAYRFGYRIVGSTTVVSAVELPAAIVEQTIMEGALLSARSSPDGTIVSQISISYLADGGGLSCRAGAIDDLVRNAVDPESLRMEEATAADLNTLLQRLERSVGLVKNALDQMAVGKKGFF